MVFFPNLLFFFCCFCLSSTHRIFDNTCCTGLSFLVEEVITAGVFALGYAIDTVQIMTTSLGRTNDKRFITGLATIMCAIGKQGLDTGLVLFTEESVFRTLRPCRIGIIICGHGTAIEPASTCGTIGDVNIRLFIAQLVRNGMIGTVNFGLLYTFTLDGIVIGILARFVIQFALLADEVFLTAAGVIEFLAIFDDGTEVQLFRRTIRDVGIDARLCGKVKVIGVGTGAVSGP